MNKADNPSFLEVQAAKAVFVKKLQHYAPCTRLQPGSRVYMSQETAVACALAEVWKQGRKYQQERDGAALLELAKTGVRA